MDKWKNRLVIGMMGLGVALMITVAGDAAPADMEIGQYKQPSGQQFEAQIVGDEFLNYVIANKTGDLINVGEDGYWYYSLLNEETKTTTPSKSKYLIDKPPADSLTVKDIDKLKGDELLQRAARMPKATSKWDKNQHVLVVLVEFNDMELSYSEADWEKRIFSQTGKSLATFYQEVTNDKITIVPAKESYGKQDGIVRVKVDQGHPNASSNFSKIRPSLKAALESIQGLVDLSEYDTNKNGLIEQNELHIVSIFAGYEATSINFSPNIWAHKGSFQGREVGYPVVDGIKLNNYSMVGERMVQKNTDPAKQYEYQAELGMIAHEFGHDLGLPDLYNLERNVFEMDGKYVSVSDGDGLGRYSVMAKGAWTYLKGENGGATPSHLDAYCKISLGIIDPTIVEKTEAVTVAHISQPDFNIFRVNTANPNEYFLVENRQLSGYDAALKTVSYSLEHGYKQIVASGGIAIYHVNENYKNNYSPNEQLVTLKEADEGILGYSKLNQLRYYVTNNYDGFYYNGMGGHGKEQQTALTKTTTPSTMISDGSFPALDIFVNSESGPTMNVTFKGKAIEVTGVRIDPETATIMTGTKKQLTAKIEPENADNKTVSWSSSNEAVATVSSTGVVTAEKAGTATITVTTEDGKKTAVSTIKVEEPIVTVTGITVSPTDQKLTVGEVSQVKAEVVPSNATNKKVNWNSSNKTVATVSSNGLVTAKALGKAVVTATTEDGGKTATVAITVKKGNTGESFDEALSMKLNGLYTVIINETKEEYYEFKPETTGEYGFISVGKLDWSAYLYDGARQRLAYNDDGNENYQFKITRILEAGKTYYLKVYNRGVYGKNTITVYPVISATSLTLAPLVTSLKEGERHQLTGKITPENTTENEKINWHSNDTSVATVSNTGEIEAKSYGTVTITARCYHSKMSEAVTIQVTSDKVGSSFDKAINLNSNEKTDVSMKNAKEKFYAFKPTITGEYSFISTGKLDWSAYLYDESRQRLSYNDDGNGNYQFKIIRKLEAGKTYYLKVYNRGEFGENTIKVYPVIRVTSLTLMPAVTSLNEGEKLQLTGTITPKNTTENEELRWTSNDTSVATVSNTGEVQGKGSGKVTITARSRYSNVRKTIIIQVTTKKLSSDFDKGINLNLTGKTVTSYEERQRKIVEIQQAFKEEYDFINTGKLE